MAPEAKSQTELLNEKNKRVFILDIVAGFLRKSLSALKRLFNKTDVISMTY